MKNKLKIIIPLATALLMAVLLMMLPNIPISLPQTGNHSIDVGAVIGTSQMKMESFPMTIHYAIDRSDYNQVAAAASYVFVGVVEEYIDTTMEEDGLVPRTCYGVKVVDTIKGQIPLGTKAMVYKNGGYNGKTGCFSCETGDILPYVGGTYIFVCSVANGNLYANGMNSAIELASDYAHDVKYNQMLKANAEGYDFVNFTPRQEICQYDPNYKK